MIELKPKIKVCSVSCSVTLYLQRQNCAGQVSSLDFRHVGRQHLISVGSLCVESVTLPWTCSAGSTCSLLGLSLIIRVKKKV